MSTMTHKRRKVSEEQEPQQSENTEGDGRSELKSRDDIESVSKSDKLSSTVSQDNRESSRAAGLVRRRKKKVFADYYYGDDIFSKPKNGTKKKTDEKKKRKTKTKTKNNSEKQKKSTSNKKGPASVKSKDDDSSKNQKVRVTANFTTSAKAIKPVTGPLNISHQPSENLSNHMNLLAKDSKDVQPINRNSVMPVKPIPQRHNGSKINFLLNACKINNSQTPGFGHSEDSLKKRDDKAIEKGVLNFQGNNQETSFMGNTNGLSKNLQDTITALLNLNKGGGNINDIGGALNMLQGPVENRRSSGDSEENLKHRTPTKPKNKHPADPHHNSHEKKARDSPYLSRKHKEIISGGLKKSSQKPKTAKEEARVSRVKQTVRNGSKTELVLESEGGEEQQTTISFNIPQRRMLGSFDRNMEASNLNKCFGTTMDATQITSKIKGLLEQAFQHNVTNSANSKVESGSAEQRITSVPILFASDLR